MIFMVLVANGATTFSIATLIRMGLISTHSSAIFTIIPNAVLLSAFVLSVAASSLMP
jgi:hypothetical protein